MPVYHIYTYYYNLWQRGLSYDRNGKSIWKKGRHYGRLCGFDIGR